MKNQAHPHHFTNIHQATPGLAINNPHIIGRAQVTAVREDEEKLLFPTNRQHYHV